MVEDIDLDILLSESAKRQQPVADINAAVMRTVRRDLRRKAFRKWARLVIGCLGVPMALVLYGFVLNEAISGSSMQSPLRIVCLALPLVTIIALLATRLRNFRMEV